MLDLTPRESILKRIRQGLIHKSSLRFNAIDWEKNIYHNCEESKEEQFAKEFTKVGGQFMYCSTELDFLENVVILAQENKWDKFYCCEKSITDYMDRVAFPYSSNETSYPEGMVAITTCEALVARLGSVIVSSKQGSGRRLFVVPTTHIILAYASQVVPQIKDALQIIKAKYDDKPPSMIASITGPSRTADIEKTLVTPAHGPREIYVFLVDD
jgi:L-lactate dehydrogenase complex protein LldG